MNEGYSQKKYKFIISEDGFVDGIVEDVDEVEDFTVARENSVENLIKILWNEYGERKELVDLRLPSFEEGEDSILIKIAKPSIDFLMKYGLEPNILTSIAWKKCKEDDKNLETKPILTKNEDSVGDRIKNLVNEMLNRDKKLDDFNEYQASILKLYCLGKFEQPNADNFKDFVQNQLQFVASTTNIPPSSWPCFENVRGKIVAYDLDMAFFNYRSHYITKTTNSLVQLASKVLLFPLRPGR